MKKRIVSLTFVILFCFSSFSFAQQSDCGDVREEAEKIKAAIVAEDAKQISAYIGQGLWFSDVPYKRNNVLALLNNKRSWLYQGLFRKRDSMKHHLSRGDREIKIQTEGNARIIEFVAKDQATKGLPPSFNLMCIDGRWNLTDIYSF